MEDQPRQQSQAAATRKCRDLSSTRGPSTTEVLKDMTFILLGGVLLLLAGLTLVGTLIGLAATAPLFVLFSPVLIPATLIIGLAITGFLIPAAFVAIAQFFFPRMVNSLWMERREQNTISGGRDNGASCSSTSAEHPYAPVGFVITVQSFFMRMANSLWMRTRERHIISGAQAENVGSSSSLTSAERSGSDFSAPIDVGQQQQAMSGGHREHAGTSNSLNSPGKGYYGPSASGDNGKGKPVKVVHQQQQKTIPSGHREDAGTSNFLNSQKGSYDESSASDDNGKGNLVKVVHQQQQAIPGGHCEDVGTFDSLNSPDRSYYGPSASGDNGKGNSVKVIREQQQSIPSGHREDAGASNSLNSPERSYYGPSASSDNGKRNYIMVVHQQQQENIRGGKPEDARASNSLDSPEPSYYGPSASEDKGKGKSIIVVDQQQQQHKDTGAICSSTSPERCDSGPSTSLASEIGNNYHVFLSFTGRYTHNDHIRGDRDTRTDRDTHGDRTRSDRYTHRDFIDHLSSRLQAVGLRSNRNFVIKDDRKINYLQAIDATLISAIKHSKVSIPVISPGYASSGWCLEELIHIIKCKEKGGQIVLPVLHNVKPYEVRLLKGEFGEAFESSKYLFRKFVMQEGPAALGKAVDSKVFESEKFGREEKLVDQLVETVMLKRREDFQPCLHANWVGIDDDVAEVMRLVDTAYTNTRVIGICGVGGIGKTTLANIIYNKLIDKFGCRSFLMDVREKINRWSVEHVQSRLISDILNIRDYQMHDSNIEIRTIESNCKEKKVLILLDDVDKKDHLETLIGDGSRFMSGSRIIVTCRDKAILESKYVHELKGIKDSLSLFCIHAFGGKRTPPEKLETLSSTIVATTGGNPLVLTIVGSLLRGEEDPKVWEENMEKLSNTPEMEVQQKLKISYDTLDDKHKQIFLDIACFFIGTDKRIAIYLWEDLDFYPLSGLEKLRELSLIDYGDNNELRMHDQLRDLGRKLAHQADKKPWQCSRLWDQAALIVLRRKEENENLESLLLEKKGSSEFMEQESFKKSPNLQFLQLSEVDFAGDFRESLSKLRWLKWERCLDSFSATNVDLRKLLIFDLSGGYISQNWRGWSLIKMDKLKVLNLSRCSYLTNTPNLSAFGNLERLILENCENLEEIHPTIAEVKRLLSLNLRGCRSLKQLPADLEKLENLEELIVDETDIQEIPPWIGSLKKLTMLSAAGCCLLTRLPSSVSRLVRLLTLNLNNCKKLEELPDSFEALGKLERLSLVCCYVLKRIPPSIGKMKALQELDLSFTRIRELPKSIGELNRLKILRISHGEIEWLPSSIAKLPRLQVLDASGCHKLKGQLLLDKSGLSSLRTLRLGRAKISRLPDQLRELSNVEHLDLLYCCELQSLPEPPSSLLILQLTCLSDKLPSLSQLSYLKEFILHSCIFLQIIPGLPSCLRKLSVQKCPKLERLSNLPKLKSLSELELLHCYGLRELDGLEALESLRILDVSTSSELSNLGDFEDSESLGNLEVKGYDGNVDNLEAIGGLAQLKSLEVLNIAGRKHIRQLDLSNMEHLKRLIVNNCKSLIEIRCHDKMESLEHFDRDGCNSLEKLPDYLAHDKS